MIDCTADCTPGNCATTHAMHFDPDVTSGALARCARQTPFFAVPDEANDAADALQQVADTLAAKAERLGALAAQIKNGEVNPLHLQAQVRAATFSLLNNSGYIGYLESANGYADRADREARKAVRA